MTTQDYQLKKKALRTKAKMFLKKPSNFLLTVSGSFIEDLISIMNNTDPVSDNCHLSSAFLAREAKYIESSSRSVFYRCLIIDISYPCFKTSIFL